jgi:DNA-binding PadR family transcriptional regulator
MAKIFLRITEDSVIRVLHHDTWKKVLEIRDEMKLPTWRGAMLYPCLHGLEQSNDVESRWDSTLKGRRREYRLTLNGAGRRAKLLESDTLVLGVPNLGLVRNASPFIYLSVVMI